MEARYKRAAELGTSIEDAFIGGSVIAHWIPGIPCFWYRKEFTSRKFSFILVNAKTREVKAAFDHEALVNALVKHGVQTSVESLPFRDIELGNDLNVIRFYIDDTAYQYGSQSNALMQKDMEESARNDVEPSAEQEASVLAEPVQKCSLIFKNKRAQAISISWVDYEGEARRYAVAEPGESSRRQIYYGHVWRVCDNETGELLANYVAPGRSVAYVSVDESTVPSEKISSADTDSPRCAVKDFNVHIGYKESEVQLSSSGSEKCPFDSDHIYHSPDNTHAIVWQYISAQKRTLYHIESTPKDQLQPHLVEKQYLKPGDKVRIDRPRLFNITQKFEIPTSDGLFDNPYSIENVGWDQTGTKYRFIYNERGHQTLRVVELDLQGNARTLVEEKQDTFVDYAHKVHWNFDKDADELLWTSERDGSNHLYLFKLSDPENPNQQPTPLQLTHGVGNVYSIEHVDKQARYVYIAMLGGIPGQDPYYKQLARVSMEPSTSDPNFTMLTNSDNNHKWTWSPDFTYFIDEASRINTPPMTNLYSANGEHILHLSTTSLSPLMTLDVNLPEALTFPGRDGITPIYGILLKPSHFSPEKQYPIIQEIYSGPQSFHVPKSFSKLSNLHALAELGFIVVKIDGVGTNWRSKKFHDTSFKNLRDAGLPDHIAWIKSAAATRPWMDTTRVGIYGVSAGGQNALAALLWHSDFYSAAIADCGCHDNRLDKLWWNELFMGWPVDSAYEENSNVVHAARLQGKLMLVVGEMDGNVDPASTLQVAKKLDDAGKDYELWFVPGGTHGSSGKGVMRRRMWDFWVRSLCREETPRWNDVGVRERLGGLFA